MPDVPESRVGYLWVPHLALSVALRKYPELDGRRVIVGGDPGTHAPGVGDGVGGAVLDASDECLAAGVRLGRPLREAREHCPDATFLPADPEADRSAHEALLDLAGRVTPEVEDDGPGRALFAPDRPVGREDARWMIATLRAMVRGRLGLRPRLALAPGPFAARAAAECDPGASTGAPVVPASEVAAYLAPLPVEVLPLPPRALERLRLLGIATVGQFATLPRSGLARRFGAEAVGAHRLAHGEDDRPVVGRRHPEVRAARRPFEPPVESREPLLAAASRLLGRLCAGVRAEGKTFRTLGVAVESERGEMVERTTELRKPAATPEQCHVALRALVGSVPLDAPASALAVTLSALAPAGGEQSGLFGGASRRDARRGRLEGAIREVERRYPSRLRRVLPGEIPTLLDEHKFALLPYEDDGAHPSLPEVPPASARPVRVERRGGRPHLVEGDRWDELVSVHGCWHAEEWWPAEVSRIYWRVRARSGRILTLSRDEGGFRLVEVLD